MSMPSPENPGRSPIWENYVVAQVVQASLGLLPRNALAVGVRVAEADIQLRFQLTDLADDDALDIDDILSELEALVGDKVRVDKSYEVREEPDISPHDGVRWIFVARQ